MLVIIASNNKHKLEEIKKILPQEIDIQSLTELGFHDDIEESGSTFEENAFIKAKVIYDHFHLPCLSDDSGLEVEALDNAPGVYSARYAGEPVDHEKNIDKLLAELGNKTNRNARFRTVLCFIDSAGQVTYFSGKVNGTITVERRGDNGFGYDPVFIPDGYSKTFAQMDASLKNSISHRANALDKFKDFIKTHDLTLGPES
jgi:XTP/dITP diphosphohydrolase